MARKATVSAQTVKQIWATITGEWGPAVEDTAEGKEPAPIVRKPVHRGLCLSCKHQLDCTFPRNPNHPVLQCEEFEGEETVRVTAERRRSSQSAEAAAEEAAEYKGLCKNCEDRATCAFPKPQGGVWRCEEYR